MQPKITVVTPSFNQAAFLEETILSVLRQRDAIHEYFVLDGGSTDGSVEIIRKYAADLDYWESGPDGGQSSAIIKGFARSTGDVLCWLNSDDVFLPGALAKVRHAMLTHPDWEVVTGYHVQLDGDSRIELCYRAPKQTRGMARWGELHVCQQTCFFTKKLYLRSGGLDSKLHYAMDMDLWLRMLCCDGVWGHVPAYLAGYRWHPTSKGMTAWPKFVAENELIYTRYPEFAASAGKRLAGRCLYRGFQLASGRHIGAQLDTVRWRHRKVTDIFPW